MLVIDRILPLEEMYAIRQARGALIRSDAVNVYRQRRFLRRGQWTICVVTGNLSRRDQPR